MLLRTLLSTTPRSPFFRISRYSLYRYRYRKSLLLTPFSAYNLAQSLFVIQSGLERRHSRIHRPIVPLLCGGSDERHWPPAHCREGQRNLRRKSSDCGHGVSAHAVNPWGDESASLARQIHYPITSSNSTSICSPLRLGRPDPTDQAGVRVSPPSRQATLTPSYDISLRARSRQQRGVNGRPF